MGHGSGRSVPGFALHEALKACTDCLLSHGGHRAAAGFKVRADAIDAFREKLLRLRGHPLPATGRRARAWSSTPRCRSAP